MVLGFFLLLKIASVALDQPVFELPPFAWFGPMAPYFADLRGIVAGTERLRAGIPPRTADLHDPWNRPFNYPKWWLYTDDLGLNMSRIMPFGYGMGALFYLSSFFILGKLRPFDGLVAGLFLISNAVLFGVERANFDLVMFILLALALGVRRVPALASLLIAVAALLKLYPLFAFVAMLAPPWKKTLPWLGFGLAFFALAELDDLHDVFMTMGFAPNMRTGTLAFGTTPWGLYLLERYHRPELYYDVVAIGSVAFLLAVGVGAWIRPRLDHDTLDAGQVYAFQLGAGVYLGSFALGTNHDYRAIFLLFCFPLLFHLLHQRRVLPWVWTTLALTLLYVNWQYLSDEAGMLSFMLKQALAWALAIGLTGLCVACLPPALQWPRPR